MMKTALLICIRGYQWLISPLLGNNCRYYPSCSSYCIEAIETHGPVRGLYLGLRRLLRCHPFTRGGIDLVPDKACCTPGSDQPPN
ncbi:MAG: putative membrane protein insertion efficiency factor [Motiliproteus sp.]|jgi:putative membrane protein insertion efficiency factor